MNSDFNTRQKTIFLIIILAVNLLLYLPSVGYDFLKDDHRLIVENPRIKSFSALIQSLDERFFAFPDFPYLCYWRPLTLFTFYVDYRLWGGEAGGYHASNILLNSLAGGILFLLIGFMTPDPRAALAGALAFSLHPCRAEAAAWISGRTDLLSAVFILAALAAFAAFLQKETKTRYALTFFFFICGLLSKENAALFPVIALGFILGHENTTFKKKIAALAPFFAILPVYFWLHNEFTGSAGVLRDVTPGQIAGIFQTIGIYSRILLFPFTFPSPYFSMMEYDHHGALHLLFLAPALGLIIWTIIRRKNYPLTIRFLWFLLFLLPVINPETAPSYPKIVMRFACLAAAPLGTFLWETFLLLSRRSGRIILITGSSLLLLTWTAQTLLHQPYFQNDKTYYSRLAERHPGDASLLLPLALLKASENQIPEALRLVNRALAADQTDRWIHIPDMAGLLKANLLILSNQPEEGRTLAEQILREASTREIQFHALIVLAKYHEKTDNLPAAFQLLLSAEKLGPTADLFHRLALIAGKMKQFDLALAYLEKTGRMNPDFPRLRELKTVLIKLRDSSAREKRGR